MITVTANPDNTTYGTAAGAVGYTPSGTLESGDTYAGILSGNVAATPGTAAGDYAIGQGSVALTSPYAALDYTIDYVGGNVVVNKADVTVTPTGSQTYGGTNVAVSYAYTGLVNGDGTGAVTGVSYSTPVTNASGVGAYGVTATGGTAGNYVVTDASGTYSVTPASLTVTPTGTQVYGGSNVAVSYAYVGLVNGDATGVVAGVGYSTPVSTASSVGAYGVTATGGTAGNYVVTDASGTYSVTPASLTVTPTGTQVYGGSNVAVSYAYVGLVNGDATGAVSGIGYVTPVTTASNVGSYGVTATGGVAGNYTITDGTGSYGVTPASLTIAVNDASRLYGTSDPVFSATFTGLVAGNTSSVVTGLGITANDPANAAAGTSWTITPSGASASNYTITYQTGTLQVSKAYLTIVAGDATRTYGASDPTYGVTYVGLLPGDSVSGITYSTTATQASNVGQYQIDASNAVAADYTIVYDPGILTITQAPLTIAAASQTRTYGSANPALGVTYAGLVDGNSPSVVSGLTVATTATGASSVGSYAITASGATAQDYAITYQGGVLTVDPAPLTITAGNVTRTQNAANPVFTATYAGFANGDGPSSLGGLTFSAPVAGVAGTYQIVPGGAYDPNYSFTYVPGVLTVTGSQLIGAGSSILSQVVNQIDVPSISTMVSVPAMPSSGQFVLQGLISALSVETGDSRSQGDGNDASSCLKVGGDLSATCAGSLTIRGF